MAEEKKENPKSELESLLMQYLSFSWSILSKIPYPKMERWYDFARMDVKKALDKGAGATYLELLKEYYVMFYLNLLITLLSSWYLIGIYGYSFGVGGLFLFLIGLMTSPMAAVVILLAILLVLAILAVVIPLVQFALSTAVLHFSAKIVGGKGTLRDTANLCVCSLGANIAIFLPLQLLTALIIGICLGIFNYVLLFYSLYLLYLGLREVHSLSPKRAVAAIILNVLIGIVVSFAALVLLYVLLIAGGMAMIVATASSAQASIAALFA